MAETKKVFTRDATGLVRQITSFDALILAIGLTTGFGWIPTFAAIWYFFPGVNLPITFILISLLVAPNVIYYIFITALMPRSGGGSYVPLSRIVHPALGIGMSFIFVMTSIINVGYEGQWLSTLALSPQLGAYGAITSNNNLVNLATQIGTPTWSFVLGTIFIVLTALVVILGGRVTLSVVRISFIIGIIGFLLILALLAITTQSQFQSNFDAFAGTGAYQNLIKSAQTNGLSTPSDWVAPTLLALPFAFFLTTGIAWNTYYSGEIRNVRKAMSISVVGTLVYFAVFFSLLGLLMEHTFGLNFITSANYLFNAASSQYSLSFPPYATALISLVNSNILVEGFLVATVISWGIIVTVGYYYFISRVILAWGFDRAVPSFASMVSDRLHTPLFAISLTAILSVVSLALITFLPTVLGLVNLTYLYVIALSMDGLAGALLTLRRKSLFEAAPLLVKKKVLGVPIIVLLGVYSVAFLIALFIATLEIPATAGPLGIVTAGTIIGTFIVGIAIYYGMKLYYARRGLDLGLAFKEIPPE